LLQGDINEKLKTVTLNFEFESIDTFTFVTIFHTGNLDENGDLVVST